MNGSAIATMIESWSGATAEFGVKDPRRFQDGVALIGSLLRGLERVRWQVARPSDGLIEAQVDIEFAPPAAP